jgi:trigger factor
LNIQTDHNDNHTALISVDLDSDEVERKKHQAAKKLARSTRIPGFRPGKAPYHMIVRHLGEGRILEEAVESLIDELYPQVLEESGVKPYGPGKLENIKLEDEPPTAQFLVPLAPEVILGDYQSIRLPFELQEVADDQVETAIKRMRDMYAEVTVVDRPAQEADLVNVILTGKLPDAENDEQFIDHEPFPVIIDTESDDTSAEWPFRGFSRILIGLSANDKITTSFTYPEDHEDEETEHGTVSLKGKAVDFEVEVTKVSSRKVPELDEDFIKKMGPYENLEEYQNAVREQLANVSENQANEKFEEKLLAELLKDANIKYPHQAVEDEVDLVLNRLKNRLENQGIGFDLYLKTRNMTEEEVREELRPGSEQRLKESLVLIEIASKENIPVDQSEVQHHLEHTLSSLISGMSEREARRTINDDVLRGLTANVYNNTLISNTLKHLRAMATGKLEKLQVNAPVDETNQDESSNLAEDLPQDSVAKEVTEAEPPTSEDQPENVEELVASVVVAESNPESIE